MARRVYLLTTPDEDGSLCILGAYTAMKRAAQARESLGGRISTSLLDIISEPLNGSPFIPMCVQSEPASPREPHPFEGTNRDVISESIVQMVGAIQVFGQREKDVR